MPELPEVERVRQTLAPLVVGRRVERVLVLRDDVCEQRDHAGALGPITPAGLLEGCTITDVLRHGKQLAIASHEGPALCVHLGMSGQVLATGDDVWRNVAGAHPPHTHVAWALRGGVGACVVRFRDPRRFGGLWAFPSLAALRRARWDVLGPDALHASGDALAHALGASRRAIKAALLDQRVLAGVGNIYADEALHRASVRPARRCDRVGEEEFAGIAKHVREVLCEAILAGGSTLRDYVDAAGNRGMQQLRLRVYGRGGEACLACGRTLKLGLVAQRTTVWCPTCQR